MQEQVDHYASRDIVGHDADASGKPFKFFDGEGFGYIDNTEEEQRHHRVCEVKPPG